MAKHTVQLLALANQALFGWEDWRAASMGLIGPPEIGKVLGQGSSSTVFSLANSDDFVVRVRNQSHHLSVNSPHTELDLWRQAAAIGLAPDVIWTSDDTNVVVTSRLKFESPDINDHAVLLSNINSAPMTADFLSLETTARKYSDAIHQSGNGDLAININRLTILSDLRGLDGEPPCFCHNDLTPENIGRSGESLMAIDWEYAATGSRHFDIAVASSEMSQESRLMFARQAAGPYFNIARWNAACRVVPLMNHLWSIAVMGSVHDAMSKDALETIWDGL